MKKIILLHKYLRFGGVERQFLNWINYIEPKENFILVLCKKDGEFLNHLDENINIVEIGDLPKFRIDLSWIIKFRRIVKSINPDIIFSLHGVFNWMLFFFKNRNRKIFLSLPGFPSKGKLYFFHKFFLKRADYIQAFFKAIDWKEVGRRFEMS